MLVWRLPAADSSATEHVIVGANIVRPQTEKRRKRPRAHTVRPYILYLFVEEFRPGGSIRRTTEKR